MNSLVTGGAGFIGSHLVERLLRDGHTVTVIDNYWSGRKENLAHLGHPKKLKIFQIDVGKPKLFLLKYLNNIDWVFHLAARADIVPSIINPLEYHQANVNGTINILEAARKSRVRKFIYTASASCYGIPTQFPTPETAPIQPQYPYALTKYVAEQYVLHWGKIFKLPVVSLRLFNVYGPRSRTSGTYGAVFGTFLAQKLANQPLTVVGNGTQRRDFTYVSDVVEAFIKAAKSHVVNEVFNVGSGDSPSINDLVKLLRGKVVYIPNRPAEPSQTLADISKIKRILNWQPKVKFTQGVKILLKNIDYWKTAPVWTPTKIKQVTKEWFRYLG